MAKIRCKLCGCDKILFNNNTFSCTNCGLQYSQEELIKMLNGDAATKETEEKFNSTFEEEKDLVDNENIKDDANIDFFDEKVDVATVTAYASKGYIEAQLALGDRLDKANRYEDAYYWFKKAAENENYTFEEDLGYALSRLGEYYFYGQGINKDEKKGVELWEKSIEYCNDDHLFDMAQEYYTGRYVNRNLAKTILYLSNIYYDESNYQKHYDAMAAVFNDIMIREIYDEDTVLFYRNEHNEWCTDIKYDELIYSFPEIAAVLYNKWDNLTVLDPGTGKKISCAKKLFKNKSWCNLFHSLGYRLTSKRALKLTDAILEGAVFNSQIYNPCYEYDIEYAEKLNYKYEYIKKDYYKFIKYTDREIEIHKLENELERKLLSGRYNRITFDDEHYLKKNDYGEWIMEGNYHLFYGNTLSGDARLFRDSKYYIIFVGDRGININLDPKYEKGNSGPMLIGFNKKTIDKAFKIGYRYTSSDYGSFYPLSTFLRNELKIYCYTDEILNADKEFAEKKGYRIVYGNDGKYSYYSIRKPRKLLSQLENLSYTEKIALQSYSENSGLLFKKTIIISENVLKVDNKIIEARNVQDIVIRNKKIEIHYNHDLVVIEKPSANLCKHLWNAMGPAMMRKIIKDKNRYEIVDEDINFKDSSSVNSISKLDIANTHTLEDAIKLINDKTVYGDRNDSFNNRAKVLLRKVCAKYEVNDLQDLLPYVDAICMRNI